MCLVYAYTINYNVEATLELFTWPTYSTASALVYLLYSITIQMHCPTLLTPPPLCLFNICFIK